MFTLGESRLKEHRPEVEAVVHKIRNDFISSLTYIVLYGKPMMLICRPCLYFWPCQVETAIASGRARIIKDRPG